MFTCENHIRRADAATRDRNSGRIYAYMRQRPRGDVVRPAGHLVPGAAFWHRSAMTTLHDFTVNTIDGAPKKLSDISGKALLIVNVASRCGLTPQYTALEELYRRFKGK